MNDSTTNPGRPVDASPSTAPDLAAAMERVRAAAQEMFDAICDATRAAADVLEAHGLIDARRPVDDEWCERVDCVLIDATTIGEAFPHKVSEHVDEGGE